MENKQSLKKSKYSLKVVYKNKTVPTSITGETTLEEVIRSVFEATEGTDDVVGIYISKVSS